MKRNILVIVSLVGLLFSMPAMALSYCATLNSGRENVTRCYQQNVEMFNSLMAKAYWKLMESDKTTPEQKKFLEAEQKDFERRVNTQCTSYECTINSLNERTQSFHNAAKQLGVKM